jgi:hypothetical protein
MNSPDSQAYRPFAREKSLPEGDSLMSRSVKIFKSGVIVTREYVRLYY